MAFPLQNILLRPFKSGIIFTTLILGLFATQKADPNTPTLANNFSEIELSPWHYFSSSTQPLLPHWLPFLMLTSSLIFLSLQLLFSSLLHLSSLSAPLHFLPILFSSYCSSRLHFSLATIKTCYSHISISLNLTECKSCPNSVLLHSAENSCENAYFLDSLKWAPGWFPGITLYRDIKTLTQQ